jgi:hypothetical protein
MRLYNSNLVPNPRRVRIFLAEKGLLIPRIEVDLAKLGAVGIQDSYWSLVVIQAFDGTDSF